MLFNNLSNNRSEESHRHHCAAFGDFVLDFDRGCIQKAGTDIPLRPKSFEVLTYLVNHHGVLVSKEELLNAVWPNVIVTEDSLIQCLIEIRKALGDLQKDMIVTVPRRGYLFDMDVAFEQIESGVNSNRKHSIFDWRQPGVLSAGIAILVPILIAAIWWNISATTSATQPIDTPATKLASQSGTRLTGAQLSANQHYEQGRFFHYRRAPGDLDKAELEYRKALAIHPEMAKAWVGLGGVYFVHKPLRESSDPDEYVQYLKKAIELEPENAEANMRLSNYYYWQGDPVKETEHLEIALKFGQDDPLVLSMAAGSLMYQLRMDDALTLQRRSVELDPTSVTQHNALASFYFYAGRLDEAKEEYNLLMQLSPEIKTFIAPSLLQIALAENDLTAATLWSELANEDTPDNRMAAAMLATRTGNQPVVDENIEWLITQGTPLADVKLAELYAYLKNQESALKWLNSSLVRIKSSKSSIHACTILAEAYYSPYFNLLQDNPEWLNWKREMSQMSLPSSSLNIAALVQTD